MVYYKPVKIIINASSFLKIVINMMVSYYGIQNLIVTNEELLFILKFWLLLYYFPDIKQRLSTTFYP